MSLEPMDEKALLSLLEDEYDDAKSYSETAVELERQKAVSYYLRRPMGNERKGRSQVISAEVFKTVEGITTAITNIFLNEKDPVEFIARRGEDVEKAKQRTEAVAYYINNQADGFFAIGQAIKDGVLVKTGYLTWRWESQKVVTKEVYNNQDEQSIALLTDNDALKIISQKPSKVIEMPGQDGQPMPVQLYNIECLITKELGRCVIESVPPDEILVSSRARDQDIQKAPIVIWRNMKTRQDLEKMGVDEELLEQIDFTSTSMDVRRISRDTDFALRSNDECELQTYWLTIDYDGDGVYEFRKIVKAGRIIIFNEITDEINLASWCPTPLPHEFYGRCPADEAVETQDIMTVLKRQTLDNIYHSNNPMWRVSNTDIQAQLLNPEIGRPFVANKDQAEVITLPFVAQHTYQMMEFVQEDNENKTGFSRTAQGMDSSALTNTATGAVLMTNMSQERVKQMARIFGECYAKAMRGVSKLLSQHCDKKLLMRLSNGYAEVDPREWAEEYDMTVNVGLGILDKPQKMQFAQQAIAAQMAIAASPMSMMVTPKNVYHSNVQLLELAGFKNAEQYFTDPETLPPPGPPPVDPAMQIEQMKQQNEAQKFQAQTMYDKEIEQLKATAKLQEVQANLELQAANDARDSDRETMKAQYSAQLDAQKLQFDKYKTDEDNRVKIIVAQIAHPGEHGLELDSETGKVVNKPDPMLAVTQALTMLAEAHSRPKQVVRGSNNEIVGVQ